MKATPATAAYKAEFDRLTSEGWTLRNYGDGWRYFSRARSDGRHDVIRVHQDGKRTEDLGVQAIA